MTQNIIINPELRDLLPPLSPEEYSGLESEIIQDGCTEKLVVWGDILVDGHHRHDICSKHGIEFKTRQKNFPNIESAKLWMWKQQKNRRNLSRFQRAEIALKMKPIVTSQSKSRQVRKPHDSVPQNSAEQKETRQILAEFADVSHDTLDRTEFLLKHADVETLNRLRWDKKGTSINKEYTRLKAELDAQKPKKEKKSRSTSTSEQNKTDNGSKKSRSASSEEQTKATKTERKTAKHDSDQTLPSESETTASNASTETIVISLKSSPKVNERYSCGVKFEPDPNDDFFDWITDKERDELFEMRKTCPNRLVPQIHNFTIQNIPEHTPEPLLSCLYSLFKIGYRKKLAYGLLRKMFDEDDKDLARTIVSELQNEFQNR